MRAVTFLCLTLALVGAVFADDSYDDSPLRARNLNFDIHQAIKFNFLGAINEPNDFTVKYGGFEPTSWSQGPLGFPNFTLINQVMVPEMTTIVSKYFSPTACYTEYGYDISTPFGPIIGANFTLCGGPNVIGPGLVYAMISDKLYTQLHTIGDVYITQTDRNEYLACASVIVRGVVANQQCRYNPACYPKSLAETRTYDITGQRCHEVVRIRDYNSVQFLIRAQRGLARMQLYGGLPNNFSSSPFGREYNLYPWK